MVYARESFCFYYLWSKGRNATFFPDKISITSVRQRIYKIWDDSAEYRTATLTVS